VKRFVVVGIGAASAAAMIYGSGTASAVNEYVGMTYDKASSQISSWGGTATIATKVGEELPTGDCIVTGSRTASFLGSSGFAGGSQVLLDLNCNQPLAEPGHAGNSAASPQGRQVQKQQKDLAWLNENTEYCSQYFDYCKQLCSTYADKCSSDIQSIVGG
jgi:hypothetical protein